MNREEKQAIEYSKNCLMKITLGIDCEFDVNILDTLLNIIKKLKKESEELKNQEATQKKINELLVQRYSNSISVQKVKDKIADKIAEIEADKLNYIEDDWYLESELKGYAIDKLKELLESEE